MEAGTIPTEHTSGGKAERKAAEKAQRKAEKAQRKAEREAQREAKREAKREARREARREDTTVRRSPVPEPRPDPDRPMEMGAPPEPRVDPAPEGKPAVDPDGGPVSPPSEPKPISPGDIVRVSGLAGPDASMNGRVLVVFELQDDGHVLLMHRSTQQVVMVSASEPMRFKHTNLTVVDPGGAIVPLMQWVRPDFQMHPETIFRDGRVQTNPNHGCGPGRFLEDEFCKKRITPPLRLALCDAHDSWDASEIAGHLQDAELKRIADACSKQSPQIQSKLDALSPIMKRLYDAIASYYVFNPYAVPHKVMAKVASYAGYALDTVDQHGYVRFVAGKARAAFDPMARVGGKIARVGGAVARGAGRAFLAPVGRRVRDMGSWITKRAFKDQNIESVGDGAWALAKWIATSSAMQAFCLSMTEMFKHLYCHAISAAVPPEACKDGSRLGRDVKAILASYVTYNSDEVKSFLSQGLKLGIGAVGVGTGGLGLVGAAGAGMVADKVAGLAANMLWAKGVETMGQRFWDALFMSCDRVLEDKCEFTVSHVHKYLSTGAAAAAAADGDPEQAAKIKGAAEAASQALSFIGVPGA